MPIDLNAAELRRLVQEAKHSCHALMTVEKFAALVPMLKWVDVVDDLLRDDEKRLQEDLETIIIEPMKMITDGCTARLSQLNRQLTTASTAAQAALETLQGDVFLRKRAYMKYANELLCSLEAVTGTKYPRIKE